MPTPQKTTTSSSNRPGSRGPGSNGPRRPGGKEGGRTYADRPKPEFDQKILDIRRVTRVMAGGRRMTFAVAMVIGDKKGSVGLGTGKGADTALAIAKALKSARKSMITIKTTKDMSLPHEIKAKETSSQVFLMPNKGKGLVAGSAVRDILTLAGLKNVTAKIHSGSKNRLNNGRATMKALALVSTKKKHGLPEVVAVPEVTPAIEK